jgi:hypothetical protein
VPNVRGSGSESGTGSLGRVAAHVDEACHGGEPGWWTLGVAQVMLIERSKLIQPAWLKASAIGTFPRSVEARMRGGACAARIRVPSARISLTYPLPRSPGKTPR